MAKNVKANGLETMEQGVMFNSLEWLTNNQPFFEEGSKSVSSKFSPEREPKVQEGVEVLRKYFPSIPEEFYQMARWWENKEARNEIKKLLYSKAGELGFDPVVFMQEELGSKVEELAGIQEAINRMRYIITYFKPRENAKGPQKLVSIDGDTYSISVFKFNELATKFGKDVVALKEAIKEVGTVKVQEEVLSL